MMVGHQTNFYNQLLILNLRQLPILVSKNSKVEALLVMLSKLKVLIRTTL